ncbi:MAG TPA: hypothetical protein VMU95_15685 [Trebonia sp.]|nr:hypothetical protein [Trebonia sp.]
MSVKSTHRWALRAALTALTAAILACGCSAGGTSSPATARSATRAMDPVAPATSAASPAAPEIGGVSGALSAVSCTAEACMAVGSYGKTSRGATPAPEAVRPLAELWDGTRWRAETPPLPPNAAESMSVPQAVLTGVSCPTTTACVAVGAYSVGEVKTAFSESWDGSRWTVRTVSVPRGATSTVLNQVSCVSAADCVTVGAFTRRADGTLSSTTPGAVPLSERWDGRAWTLQDGPPSPTGAQASYLSSVSCTAPASCTAVGATLATASAATSFAVSWDGRTWSARPVAAPVGATSTVLVALSCIAPAACTAIGYAVLRASLSAITETWDGRTWHVLADGPSSGPGATLVGLACLASAACLGVGSVASAGRTQPAANVLDNGSWGQRTPRDPAGAQTSSFSGVSCAADGCMAVGQAIPSATVAMSQWWNGRTWALEPVPMPAA